MSIKITNGPRARRANTDVDDDIDEDEAWKAIEFDYYAEGPAGKEGHPDNENAIAVEVSRGEVTIREWQLRDFRDEDPDSEPEWGLQEVVIDLDDLMASYAKWRGTSGSDNRDTTLADVLAMPPAQQQKAIIKRALSRIGYGPNDESIVEGIGSTDETYRNNPSKSKKRKNPRSAPDKYGDRTGYHMSLNYGQLPTKAKFTEIWEDEMGSRSYNWDLKNRDGDVVSAVKDEFQDKYPALKGVTDSGIRDADAAWVLLHTLKKYHEEPGEPEDSEDMSAEEIEEWQNEWAEEAGNLASALLETLGIEWV